MKKSLLLFNLLFLAALFVGQDSLMAQSSNYKTPDQVIQWVKQLEKTNPGVVKSTTLAITPGERPVYLLEIGTEINSQNRMNPSVFVGANLEGDRPLTTEGAVFLASSILADPTQYDSLTWYIVPQGNPDAANRYFNPVQFEDSRNDLPTNDDRDDQTDEDGVNDLNGDGWITSMRVSHPDGTWKVSDEDPRLMQIADPGKGEKGVYKIYTEGIDEDGDGSYNEDGPGGTNVGINFPQLYKHYTASGGIFPGSTPESHAIMKFVFEHPDIAMIVSFGSTNWCYTPPKGGRKGEADLNKIRLSDRQAKQFNLDASRTYSLTELVQIFKAKNPQMDIDESMIAGFLGLGAALNPQQGDLDFYNKYAKEYKEFLEEQGVEQERADPAPAKDGSFELWGYFQVGVPVFSMDLWAINKADAGKESTESKKDGAPKNGGKAPENKMLAMEKTLLAYSDSLLGSKGFVDWESYEHPTLGEVEIGGFAPYLGTTPPYEWGDSLLKLQVPWILKLAGELPDLHIYDVKSTPKGNGVYQLDIWIENRAFIPFPTDMGSRNGQPAPAVLTMEGEQVEMISGYTRTPISRVGGLSKVRRTLIIHMDKPGKITLKLDSKTAGHDLETIKVGG